MKTLDKIFKDGQETARHLFNKQGEVSPMWITVTKTGAILPIVVQMDENKERVSRGLRALFKQHSVVRYVSIIEAWILEPKTKELPENIRLGGSFSQHPDRREIIWVTAEESGKSRAGMFYILRPEHGKPTLSPFKEFPTDGTSEGRFANMLDAN